MKICFFCKIKDRKLLDTVEFYKQDIDILRTIDPDLTIATNYSEIDWKADVIFIWWWTYALYPTLIAKMKGKKTYITGTYNYKCPEADRDYFRRPYWQRILLKLATKLTDKNIFVSKLEYEQIEKDWKLKNIVYSPHSIDTEKYSPSPCRTNDFLFTICWMEKENIKRKCIIETIDAIRLVTNKHPEIKLYIAGHKGDASEYIKDYIIKQNLHNNIFLIGEISPEEKIKYLRNCKIYLQPSRYEGFGLAIAEALSCGAPVITTAVGEVPVVVDNVAILVTPEPSNIATAIEILLNQDTSLLNKKSRERIEKNFPLSRREKEIKNILKQRQ
ncbi:glycosyltransferase family 4 protein [Parabacteroides gordonii]|jgi:glycosyltransferase involved in cell wall biosynthesis|uniref:glycosyltransferase family 4 protein n=1 Tax=Parabacteroides gordonii TaxID=574930 RepID=UPI00241C75DD|nr:glycosyltransferase family 4 protein [Parabacteroides gordonii]